MIAWLSALSQWQMLLLGAFLYWLGMVPAAYVVPRVWGPRGQSANEGPPGEFMVFLWPLLILALIIVPCSWAWNTGLNQYVNAKTRKELEA